MKKGIVTCLVVTSLLCVMSCQPLGLLAAGGVAGAGGYKYYKGGLTVLYQAPYIQVWDAALTALKKMKFAIESAKHDLTYGKISARGTDNTPVTVALKYESTDTTKAIIRVGFLGDSDKGVSLAIKEQIQKTLID